MNESKNIQALFPGGYFHVYNRGNNKELIFKEHENYLYFLNLWKKYISPIADTFCYSLLPNHFHFFIRIKDISFSEINPETSGYLSKQFSNLFNAYAKAYNKQNNRTGSLFQERFRRKEISSDFYFTALVGYIITNNMKHSIGGNASDYPYGAYRAIISEQPTLLMREDVLNWFGGRNRFIEYIRGYEKEVIDKKLLLESVSDD